MCTKKMAVNDNTDTENPFPENHLSVVCEYTDSSHVMTLTSFRR